MAKANEGLCKRLHLVLDSASFEKLSKIKQQHGDATYTASIKRAIAMTEFIDEQIAQGQRIFIGSKSENVREITFVS